MVDKDGEEPQSLRGEREGFYGGNIGRVKKLVKEFARYRAEAHSVVVTAEDADDSAGCTAETTKATN